MSCSECDRRAKYMANDPEMYRGDDTRCAAHRELAELRTRVEKAVAVLVCHPIADPAELCVTALGILEGT